MLGVAPSVLPNTRLLAAVNIVSGDPDVIKRVYLSTEHAAHGFYVLRFFQEDPRSDDDWKVVLVDDRLICAISPLYLRYISPISGRWCSWTTGCRAALTASPTEP